MPRLSTNNFRRTALNASIVALVSAGPWQSAAAITSDAKFSIDGTSYFTMNGSTADTFVPAYEGQFIAGKNGLELGVVQAATGSHGGDPDGSENSNIDNAWSFFFNTGMHQTTAAPTVLSDDGAGNLTLDFSGWSVTWNGIADIPMGAGAWAGNAEGVANVTCSSTCTDGDTYELTYSATVPEGDPSNFGGVGYYLRLTGVIEEDLRAASCASFTTVVNQDSSGNIIDLLAQSGATDPDGVDADLVVTLASDTTAFGGTLINNEDGTVTYDPAAGFSGADTVDFEITGVAGTPTSCTGTIQANAVNPVVQVADGSAIPATPGAVAAAVNSTGEVTAADLTANGVPEDDTQAQTCIGGCYDIEGASVDGASRFVIPLSAGIPISGADSLAQLRTLVGGSWQDFVEDENNVIQSALGELGSCPPPGNVAYGSGAAGGFLCLQLTVQDGGPNDANSGTADVSGITTGFGLLVQEPVLPPPGFTGLKTGTVLTLDAGTDACIIDQVNGLPADTGIGSCFGMETSPGFVGMTNLDGANGIIIGAVMGASPSHSGPPDGTEIPAVDQPWIFFGNTGMHKLTKPVTDLGNFELDLEGWAVSWNAIDVIPMNSRANAVTAPGFEDGVAKYTCVNDCGHGDTYALDYSATVPTGDPSGFGDVSYSLHLEGTIVVPEGLSASGGYTVDPGPFAAAAGVEDTRMTEGEIAAAGIPLDEGSSNPSGIYYDFSLDVTSGSTVSVVVPLSMPLGDLPAWRKFDPASQTWSNFNANATDSIASAPGSLGTCPPAGDAAYVNGLTTGHYCVQLTIQDNGLDGNDTDPTAGVIADPGFAASGAADAVAPEDDRTSGSSGCTLGDARSPWKAADWWLVAAALGMLGLRLRRRNTLG